MHGHKSRIVVTACILASDGRTDGQTKQVKVADSRLKREKWNKFWPNLSPSACLALFLFLETEPSMLLHAYKKYVYVGPKFNCILDQPTDGSTHRLTGALKLGIEIKIVSWFLVFQISNPS